MTRTANSREITLDILIEVLENGGYSHIVLRNALAKYQYFDKSERAFISRIAEGTIEYLIQIDYIINSYSKVKVNKMKPVIRNLLRMSVYQIMYMDRIPDSAVCNEAVKLAEKRKFTGLKGFVNGVLRNIARSKASIEFPSDSVRYSMPDWIISMWKDRYGDAITTKILKAFLDESRTAVRCNLDQADKEVIIDSLTGQQVVVEETEYSDTVLYLKHYDHLDALEAFVKGWIQVQDLSSSFVGEAAAPKSGDYVIDVCGAPGGKSLHIADQLKGSGMVEVRDLSYQKVQLIEENIARTGFTNIKTKLQDALETDQDSIGKADIVLADLPCSGLGIIGRKPDIKYRMTPEILSSLSKLQRDILSVVWQYVKPGGRLIYSTCTINPEENADNAEWFLNHYPFKPVNLENQLGKKLRDKSIAEGWLQLLPGIHPCDGFFISVFQRVE